MNLLLCAVPIFAHRAATSIALTLLPLIVLTLVVLTVATIVRRRNESFSQPSTPSASGADDKRYWVAGLIYVNPNDPALLVRKRFGFGRTLNFGHRASWLIMILILSIPVLVQFLVGHH